MTKNQDCPSKSGTVGGYGNINVSFIIHVNFDLVWAEYYPITLSDCLNNEMFTTSLVAAVHKVRGHYERK